MRRLLSLLLCAAVLGGVGWWAVSAFGSPVVERATLVPAPAIPDTDSASNSEQPGGAPDFPAEFYAKHPPGSRVPLRLPTVDRGIPIGGGVFVPALNGVRIEDGISPIRRDPRLPPPGPVVAKRVDLSGQEWWEHADGSQTSCSYASVTVKGVSRTIVSTQHGAARPGGHGTLPARK